MITYEYKTFGSYILSFTYHGQQQFYFYYFYFLLSLEPLLILTIDCAKFAAEGLYARYQSLSAVSKSADWWCICNWISFTRPFLLGPVFLRTSLPCPGGYHQERDGMPLHGAVAINWKNGATTENQGADVKYMGWGVYVDDCMCVIDLTF